MAAILAASGLAAMPAQAAKTVSIPSCASIGLDDIIPGADACIGYFDKNVLKSDAGSFAKAEEVSALNQLGLLGSQIKVLEKINNSGDFKTLLNGLTYIGVHFGAGQGPVNTPGGVTAFYRFNAGQNLDKFAFRDGSVSGVALYSTGPAVPEPATWAMMLGGFGLMGAAMRRRRKSNFAYA